MAWVPTRGVALLAAVLASTLGACAGGSSSPVAAPDDEPDPVVLRCDLEVGTGEITVDGQARAYQLHRPEPGTEPVPVVVAFHGYSSSVELIAASTGLAELGPAAGAAVVFPQAVGDPTSWAIFDGASTDNGFVDTLVADLADDPCLDGERVWLAGHSGGAAYAGVYGCGNTDRVAGLWLNAGLPPPICPEGAGVDIRIVHGTEDPVVPFDGGAQPVDDSAIELDTVPASAAGWAERAGCDDEPTVRTVDDAEITVWDGCAGGATVSLAAVDGGTHVWPNHVADPAYPATCELLAAVTGSGGAACEGGS